MAGNYYFVIVGHLDNPLYEAEYFTPAKANDPKVFVYASMQKDGHKHLTQFIAHAALDLVDEQFWNTPNMYLKVVDKFNEWLVSAFVSASRMRFLVLHDVKNEEGIKNFFQEVYELFVKHAMNPFYRFNCKITSPTFEKKALSISRKFLA